MNKIKSSFYLLVFTSFIMILSSPLQALWGNGSSSCGDCCDTCCDDQWGISGEVRVAYYRPSSSRVRRIYGDGDGWADYQFELAASLKRFTKNWIGELGLGGCGCDDLDIKLWVGVSGFSRKGESLGFGDHTRLSLVPVNFGLKIYYPIFCNTNIYVGGGASYSILRIKDDSEYVHRHTNKEAWGGLVQSGITYNFTCWGYVSAFFDYYFQEFHFHDTEYSSFSTYSYYQDSRFIERNKLDMSGYKVGVGIGIIF